MTRKSAELNLLMDPTDLRNEVYELKQRILSLERAVLEFNELAEAAPRMGDQRAGRFLALSAGSEPTEADAIGTFISSDGESFGGTIYHIGGTKLGVLTWGANSLTAQLMAGMGAVILDENGIKIGKVGTFLEFDNGSVIGAIELIPGYGTGFVSFKYIEKTVTNPGFENGLTGWTTWYGSPTASSAYAHGGIYSLRMATNDEIASGFISVSERDGLLSFWMYPTATDCAVEAAIICYTSGDVLLGWANAIGPGIAGTDINYWQKFLLVGHYPATTAKVRIYFKLAAGSAPVYIDDVRLLDGYGFLASADLSSGGMLLGDSPLTLGEIYVTSLAQINQLALSTDLAITEGGTGASTAANARTNLGAVNIAGDTMTGDLIFGLRSVQGTTPADIADDTAISFTPANQLGMILIEMRSNFDNADGLLAYRVSPTVNRMTKLAGGANLLTYTGVLTGTTGTDGKLNISAYTDGKIYIENRMGGTRSIHYILLGG